MAQVITDSNATNRSGIIDWSMDRDEEGHRTYKVSHLVKAANFDESPTSILVATGLPTIGQSWNYGGDIDGFAYCLPTRSVKKAKGVKGEGPYVFWNVTSTFSTKRNSKRCQDVTIEDPLQEPDRVNGSFVKYVKEVMKDKDGNQIKTSSHEIIRGPQVEFDHNRPTVTISQNVADLELDLFAPMVDTVNDASLWGLGSRRIKLSNVSWSREIFGVCSYYYVRTFEFDVDSATFDRDVLDEGTKVLNGHWTTDQTGTGTGLASTWVLDNIDGAAPNKNNPQHFIRYKDRNGENSRLVLDGNGEPLDGNDDPVFINVQYYSESNFLLLGIPTIIDL